MSVVLATGLGWEFTVSSLSWWEWFGGWPVEAEGSQQQGLKCRCWGVLFILHLDHPRYLTSSRSVALRPEVWGLFLPPLALSSSLPATHREVRHSVVVRLEHSGVLEDVIPKCVEPIQRDQEISAGNPFLGKKTRTLSASALGLLHWKIQSPAP